MRKAISLWLIIVVFFFAMLASPWTLTARCGAMLLYVDAGDCSSGAAGCWFVVCADNQGNITGGSFLGCGCVITV